MIEAKGGSGEGESEEGGRKRDLIEKDLTIGRWEDGEGCCLPKGSVRGRREERKVKPFHSCRRRVRRCQVGTDLHLRRDPKRDT